MEENQKFEVQPEINEPLKHIFSLLCAAPFFQLIYEIYKYHSAKRAVDAALSNSSLLICAASSQQHLASLNAISFTVGETQLMEEFKLLWPTGWGGSLRVSKTQRENLFRLTYCF